MVMVSWNYGTGSIGGKCEQGADDVGRVFVAPARNHDALTSGLRAHAQKMAAGSKGGIGVGYADWATFTG